MAAYTPTSSTRLGRLHMAARYWRDRIPLKAGAKDTKASRQTAMVKALEKAGARCKKETLEKCLGTRNDPNPDWLPESETLLALCSFAGVSLDWLTTGKGHMLIAHRQPGATPEAIAAYLAEHIGGDLVPIAESGWFAVDGAAALHALVRLTRDELQHVRDYMRDISILQTAERADPTMGVAYRQRAKSLRERHEARGSTVSGVIAHDPAGRMLRSIPAGGVRLLAPSRLPKAPWPADGTVIDLGGVQLTVRGPKNP